MRLLNDKIRALIRILFPRRGSLTRDRRPLCHLHNYTFPFPADAFPRLYVRRTRVASVCVARTLARGACARVTHACVKRNARGSLRVWWRHARRTGRGGGAGGGVEATASVVVPLAVVGRVDRSGFSGERERKREDRGGLERRGARGLPPA